MAQTQNFKLSSMSQWKKKIPWNHHSIIFSTNWSSPVRPQFSSFFLPHLPVFNSNFFQKGKKTSHIFRVPWFWPPKPLSRYRFVLELDRLLDKDKQDLHLPRKILSTINTVCEPLRGPDRQTVQANIISSKALTDWELSQTCSKKKMTILPLQWWHHVEVHQCLLKINRRLSPSGLLKCAS